MDGMATRAILKEWYVTTVGTEAVAGHSIHRARSRIGTSRRPWRKYIDILISYRSHAETKRAFDLVEGRVCEPLEGYKRYKEHKLRRRRRFCQGRARGGGILLRT